MEQQTEPLSTRIKASVLAPLLDFTTQPLSGQYPVEGGLHKCGRAKRLFAPCRHDDSRTLLRADLLLSRSP